jgi:hypothetical protein
MVIRAAKNRISLVLDTPKLREARIDPECVFRAFA